MAEITGISWCHATLNFWLGCDKVAPECARCYISRVLIRQGRQPWGEIYRTKTWKDAAKWQRKHAAEGDAIRVFTCSLSDFFHVKADPWRDEAWAIIRDCPNLIWLILTKRPERMAKRLPKDWGDGYPNVWLGVSTGCKQTLNKMNALRKIPVHPQAVRWISAEPLLEDISDEINLDGYNWIVAGGESGSGGDYIWNPKANWRKEFDGEGRRLMKIEWAQRLREKAKAAGIPYLMKQATSPRPGEGANLLGKVWHEMPSAPGGLPWASPAEPHSSQLWTPIQIEQYRAHCEG